MGTSAASEPLNFFIIVIYDLRPTYSFLLLFGRIDHFTERIYLIDVTILTKYVIKLAKNLNSCAN